MLTKFDSSPCHAQAGPKGQRGNLDLWVLKYELKEYFLGKFLASLKLPEGKAKLDGFFLLSAKNEKIPKAR